MLLVKHFGFMPLNYNLKHISGVFRTLISGMNYYLYHYVQYCFYKVVLHPC